MSQLVFEYQNRIYRLGLSKLNFFFGGSQSGKTGLLDFFENGFLGNDDSFLFDRKQIVKKQFSVIKVKEYQNIEDELKLTAKTHLNKVVKGLVSSIDVSAFNENIKEITSELQIKLNDELSFVREGYPSLVVNRFNELDMNKFIKEQFTFFDEDKLSNTMKREIFLYLNLRISGKEFRILLIDDFDNDMDISQMIKLIDLIEKEEDLIVFLMTKSSILCELYYGLYPIYYLRGVIVELDRLFDDIIFEDLASGEQPYLMVDDEECLRLKMTYSKTFLHEILLYLSGSDSELMRCFFEKRGIFNNDCMKLYEKIEKYFNDISPKR